jgi:hypothetical protein
MAVSNGRRVYDGRYIGLAIHQFIAMLFNLTGELTPARVLALAPEHDAVQGATAYRQAAIQRLATAAFVYWRLFRPGPEWTFVGAEQPAGRVRFDLLWSRGDELFADELKTGPSAALIDELAIRKQAAKQLAAGQRHHGEPFLGVRVLLLAEPKRSYWLRPSGHDEPIFDPILIERN